MSIKNIGSPRHNKPKGSSKIQWTGSTWNPVHGCKPVSPGCANCYAEPMTARLEAMGQKDYAGLTKPGTGRKLRVWTGKFREAPEALGKPLHWKAPRTIFVNSMSDLFGEGVSDEFIAEVFGVMAATLQHTYQVLTKRAERLVGWERWLSGDGVAARVSKLLGAARTLGPQRLPPSVPLCAAWPLPNVWLGVSVEDRKHGLPRIDELRKVPAAVRFLSIEPLFEDIGEIDLTGIHWVIVGGESGPSARPFRMEWARRILAQCRRAQVPFFLKQAGSYPQWGGVSLPGEEWPAGTKMTDDGRGGFRVHLRDKKGGDPAEWPADLRVREMPARAM